MVDVDDVNWGNTAVSDFGRFVGPDNGVRLQVRSEGTGPVNVSEVYPVLTGDLE
jgi:hypothetical protein